MGFYPEDAKITGCEGIPERPDDFRCHQGD